METWIEEKLDRDLIIMERRSENYIKSNKR
jgi:hypothetical protein